LVNAKFKSGFTKLTDTHLHLLPYVRKRACYKVNLTLF
jgi:hypothetical protein